jgi:hypothetical protein
MKLRYTIALGVPLLSAPAMAADMAVKIEIPRLNVAEYHRPYVALWLENPDKDFVANLAVWYNIKKKDNGGTKWLKDMRQWWRKSGRELKVPVDGVTSATRAPGEQNLNFSSAAAPLDSLPAGEYQLVVEAARESGGRELVRVPFQWPPASAQDLSTKGEGELGTISIQLKP